MDVLFIGDVQTLAQLKVGLQYPFSKAKWNIREVNTIEEAQSEPGVSVVVVFAYGDFYVEELSVWENHPPVIWCYNPGYDAKPIGVTALSMDTLHINLFETAKKLVA